VNDSHDTRQRFDPTRIDASIVADESYRRALRTGHRVRDVPHLIYDRNYALHVRRGRAMAHDYKHDALYLRYGAESHTAWRRSVN
jgi:hypothetical protein